MTCLTCNTSFNDITWAPATEGHPRGIIAGALDNNSLYLWDAQKLIDDATDALISQAPEHTAAIKALEFNPHRPEILATVGAEGDLHIYDVGDTSHPIRLGSPQPRADDLECVAWNRKFPNILATGSAGGIVTVWNVKTKKESVRLKNKTSQKAIGAIAWDPDSGIKLLTANADDATPIILLWDFQNSMEPERVLQGHAQGILSLSWCQQDSSLLLSCGKDNKTMCWNPQTGEVLGEFPDVAMGHGSFQTQFSPNFPGLLATASLDGKIVVHTLQDTCQPKDQSNRNVAADGEDFFSTAQSQLDGSSLNLKRAPKWLGRPIGASFGFGGKLIIFSNSTSENGGHSGSKIEISQFSADADIAQSMEKFEELLSSNDIAGICKSHMESAKTDEEAADWEAIKAHAAPTTRDGLRAYLGFSAAVDGGKDSDAASLDPIDKKQGAQYEQETTVRKGDSSNFFEDNAEDDEFLSKLTPTQAVKTNDPFELMASTDSAADQEVTKALVLGDYEKAADICIREKRMADALAIAVCKGDPLLERVQKQYLSHVASTGPRYIRLLSAVAGRNVWDIVHNADLSTWKGVMATICSHASPEQFSELCEALGDRMLETGHRKDASFCFVAGSKLEKVIGIWLSELQDQEHTALQQSGDESTFSVHARTLQNFVEKVTVFRQVTKFEDTEKSLAEGWKLSPLYQRYIEYADILASNGHLGTASKYLDLLPNNFQAAEVARNRVKQASKKTTTQTQVRQQQSSSLRASQRALPTQTNSQPPQPPVTATSAYTQLAPTPGNNPYAPPTSHAFPSQTGYMPTAPMQPNYGNQRFSPQGLPQANAYGQYGAPVQPVATLPPPPPKAKDMSNWNDTPMVTKPAISRRSTPGMTPAPITSPFPNQPNIGAPVGPPYGGLHRGTPTPPPPPTRGSGPPRIASPRNNTPAGQFQGVPRPLSTSNAYAPSPPQNGQPFGQSIPPPMIARGPSPYNPPPAAAPPTTRYAPAPAPQQSASQLPGQIAPPPQSNVRLPPANPYAPQQASHSGPGPYAQAQGQFAEPPRQVSAPRATPHTSRPPTGQGQASRATVAAPPAAPKYPPGDRSHIPAAGQEMVDILSNDMQRVAAKAPANFAPQVKDTQKRLNILFDHLNNQDLLKPETVAELAELARALQARNYDVASRMQVDIQKNRLDECGNWMVSAPVSEDEVAPVNKNSRLV